MSRIAQKPRAEVVTCTGRVQMRVRGAWEFRMLASPRCILPMDPHTHHDAKPAFVIHILDPLMTHESPFLTARVEMPATSDPAPGSVTAYDACSGADVRRPRYSFFCASFPAMTTGATASPFAWGVERGGGR